MHEPASVNKGFFRVILTTFRRFPNFPGLLPLDFRSQIQGASKTCYDASSPVCILFLINISFHPPYSTLMDLPAVYLGTTALKQYIHEWTDVLRWEKKLQLTEGVKGELAPEPKTFAGCSNREINLSACTPSSADKLNNKKQNHKYGLTPFVPLQHSGIDK